MLHKLCARVGPAESRKCVDHRVAVGTDLAAMVGRPRTLSPTSGGASAPAAVEANREYVIATAVSDELREWLNEALDHSELRLASAITVCTDNQIETVDDLRALSEEEGYVHNHDAPCCIDTAGFSAASLSKIRRAFGGGGGGGGEPEPEDEADVIGSLWPGDVDIAVLVGQQVRPPRSAQVLRSLRIGCTRR